MFKHEKLNFFIFAILVLLQVLGVIGLLTRFHLSYLPVMIVLYFWGGLSTTLYLHRYLTHRGFEMPEWLKFIFATGSAVFLAGDPVTWVGDHRYHHLKSDTDEDIHSPLHGFPYAHMMWLIRKPEEFRGALVALRGRRAQDLVLPFVGAQLPLRPAASRGRDHALVRLRFHRNALVSLRSDARHLQYDLGGEFDLPHAEAGLSEF